MKKQTGRKSTGIIPFKLRARLETKRGKKDGKAMDKPSEQDQVKKKQKRSRKRVLRDVRRLQQTNNLLLPRLPFQRVIREVSLNLIMIIMSSHFLFFTDRITI